MLGEMSSGEMSFWEKCHGGETYPREKCYTGRNVVGRNVAGRNVIGEKNLWGETSWNPSNVAIAEFCFYKYLITQESIAELF